MSLKIAIKNKKEDKFTFGQIGTGSMFQHNNTIFIKTSMIPNEHVHQAVVVGSMFGAKDLLDSVVVTLVTEIIVTLQE